MFTYETLDVIGYRDRQVPHTFLRQEAPTDQVAILLPGVGYTAYMPLLYYPMRVLLTQGADVLRVETVYVKEANFEASSAAEKGRWVFSDATAVCKATLAQRAYQRITLVGKSLGTLAMGYLLTTQEALSRAQAVWLTPLLGNDMLRRQIRQAEPRSLFVAGTADPHHDAEGLEEMQTTTGGETVLVEGANHSLEIEGDVMASLQALERVVRAVQDFVKDGG